MVEYFWKMATLPAALFGRIAKASMTHLCEVNLNMVVLFIFPLYSTFFDKAMIADRPYQS